ncbi:hypothetical protein CP533_2650 [Ophiocordyceps camponoti-saundersi (nom. inval.)]|nr:hypothetical protein CP533_2650 [Ophiocordyceps camponoti-saundersi (nom. inval.)]
MAALGRFRGLFGQCLVRSFSSSWPRKTAVRYYSSTSSSASSSSSIPSSSLSSSSTFDHFRFSYFAKPQEKIDYQRLFNLLADLDPFPESAVILVTPDFYTDITENYDVISPIISKLPRKSPSRPFHILIAVVDGIPSTLPAGTPTKKALSVLSGRLEELLPDMWKPRLASSSSREADSVGAIEFDTGDARITLPLARTTFLNGMTSTLVALQYTTSGESLTLEKSLEKNRQRIVLPPVKGRNLFLRIPLVPITHSRIVTDSFGNIIKTVEVNGKKSVPASMELEKAVETLASKRFPSGVPPESWGIWAMVTAESSAKDVPNLSPFPLTEPVSQDHLKTSSQHLEQLCKSGGRLYRILSGGGGWGNKKGLLSLDPQQSHPCPGEDDGEMLPDTGTFEIAPPGSRIQFFATASEPLYRPPRPARLVVGVSDGPGAVGENPDPDSQEAIERRRMKGHDVHGSHNLSLGQFGALSSSGIFVDGCIKSKLDTPGCRLDIDTSGD